MPGGETGRPRHLLPQVSSCQLLSVSCQLLSVSCQLLSVSCQLSVSRCWEHEADTSLEADYCASLIQGASSPKL